MTNEIECNKTYYGHKAVKELERILSSIGRPDRLLSVSPEPGCDLPILDEYMAPGAWRYVMQLVSKKLFGKKRTMQVYFVRQDIQELYVASPLHVRALFRDGTVLEILNRDEIRLYLGRAVEEQYQDLQNKHFRMAENRFRQESEGHSGGESSQ